MKSSVGWASRPPYLGHRLESLCYQKELFRTGEWRLGERYGWPDNRSYLNLAAWGWRLGEERRLIIVNLASHRSQARVPLPWEDLAGRPWRLTEAFTREIYERDGLDLLHPGLFVDLEPWQFHFFRVA